jgi:hypothetical protein
MFRPKGNDFPAAGGLSEICFAPRPGEVNLGPACPMV